MSSGTVFGLFAVIQVQRGQQGGTKFCMLSSVNLRYTIKQHSSYWMDKTLAQYSALAKKASYQIRIDILNTVYTAKGGHLGGSLSVADILSSIYSFYHDYKFEVILSKGHCLLAWLCALKYVGELDSSDLQLYYQNGARFAGHPKKNSTASITWGTGSLGHGLSVTCGKAMANPSKKYICVLGDGEMNEGSVWEAFMFLSQHSLSNILVIIDNNKQESLDLTANILSIEDLYTKFTGFHFDVFRIDGHCINTLCQHVSNHLSSPEKLPTILIADTIKGKGVSFMEGVSMWHHRKLKDHELSVALSDVSSS